MSAPIRSWLFVSGSRPEHFAKAMASAADAVVFDLEDSVPSSEKDLARNRLTTFLAVHATQRAFVRVNPTSTDPGAADLKALADLHIGGLRVPKVEGAKDLAEIGFWMDVDRLYLQATIETAAGVRRLEDIADSPLVSQLVLGEADLTADLGMSDRSWLQPLRIQVVVHSRAAGLPGPVQGPYRFLDDDEGLISTTREARSMGFAGRSAIHPRQLDAINAAFQPQDDDVRQAEEVIRALREAEAEGRGATRLPSGRFVDLATAREALRVLQAAQRTGGIPPDPATGARHEAGT